MYRLYEYRYNYIELFSIIIMKLSHILWFNSQDTVQTNSGYFCIYVYICKEQVCEPPVCSVTVAEDPACSPAQTPAG